jgi:hypothetical protein
VFATLAIHDRAGGGAGVPVNGSRRWSVRAAGVVALLAALAAPVAATVHRAAGEPVGAAEQLAGARARLDAAEARLVALETERAVIEADHEKLDLAQAQLARELERALRDTRQFAVEFYVAGGPNGSVAEVLSAGDVGEAIWRSEVLAGQTDYGLSRAGAARDLLGRADNQVRQIALRSDQNLRKVENATLERFFASLDYKQAEQRLVAERVGPLIIDSDAPEGSMEAAWAKLRQCEASGNYRAISPSGTYRGAYQFDQRTWESVGGEGDPAEAPPSEQDLRAKILYDRRGRQPWPVCGRFLP